MIVALLAAASLTAKAPPVTAPTPPPAVDASIFQDASHAVEAGRFREARLLLARAISAGYRGAPVARLTADLNYASGKYVDAWVAFQRLAFSSDKRKGDCEKGAISALQIGRYAEAKPLAECAVAADDASWHAWNARGVLADAMQDWPAADEAYSRAHDLAPNEARIVNNQGWSKLTRGDWAAAASLFREAAQLDPKSVRIANNLELANAALSADLPQRNPGESGRDWAVRLNDAGVAAELLGDRQRAVAAFSQAIDASPSWFERASNNLKELSQN